MDNLCFKYADMPAGKHIYIRKLQHYIIVSLSIPQYVHIHQGNSPVMRTQYAEIQDLGLVSYRSLYTVIKVGTKTIPIVARIVPGMSIPLLIGMNNRDAHAERRIQKHKERSTQ